MNVFSCKTKIVSGDGTITALSEITAKRVFLVADPYFVKDGTATAVLNATNAQHTEIFDGVQPDPSVELVAEGALKLKTLSRTWLLR